MVSGTPPFNEARADEFYYKNIVHKRWDLFWKFHYKGKPSGENFFTAEFKDLI